MLFSHYLQGALVPRSLALVGAIWLVLEFLRVGRLVGRVVWTAAMHPQRPGSQG